MSILLNLYDSSIESYSEYCKRMDILCPNITVHFEDCNRCQQGWILYYTIERFIRGRSDSDIDESFNSYSEGHRHQAIQRKQRRMYQWYLRHVKNRKIPKSLYFYFNMIYRQQHSEYKLTSKEVSDQFKSLPPGSLRELAERYEHFKQNPVLPPSRVIHIYCDYYKRLESTL